jgi:uncharacterized protein YvpB
MIAVDERPVAVEAPVELSGFPQGDAWELPPRRRPLVTRLSSVILVVALLSTIGGGGLVDSGGAYALQARAAAIHTHWDYMRANGIPESDLAPLEQEWTLSQASKILGAGTLFWIPGGADTLDRWQAAGDALWARDLSRYRTDALTAEQSLHRELGTESFVQRKARLDAFDSAVTPLDFSTLRDEWALEAKLVPVDRRLAGLAAAVADQAQQAKKLGIRSDPAADVLADAAAYTNLDALGRMSRAEFLSRNLVSLQSNLQVRLKAAAVAQQNLQQASDAISTAALYGIGVSSYQSRLATDQGLYANALTVAQFSAVTADSQQITAAADHDIYVVVSQTHVISGVTFIYQNHSLSCEEAATSMALTHQGIQLSQDQILSEVGADRRAMYVDSAGRVRWGNPYETFVGNVNGSESNYTGFGTFYPPLVRVAKAHGASIIAYGNMSAATIYARVIAGHPVVAFATWDWGWHPRRDYLSFDGQWIPWIGPYYASHVYTVVGVSPGSVLVNDPIRGQYWVSKGDFEAAYSDFNEAIVFA